MSKKTPGVCCRSWLHIWFSAKPPIETPATHPTTTHSPYFSNKRNCQTCSKIRRLSELCLVCSWWVSSMCLDDIWKVSGRYKFSWTQNLLPQVLSNLMPTWLQCMGHIGVHSKSTKPINIGDILYTGTKPDNSCHKAVIVGYRMVELWDTSKDISCWVSGQVSHTLGDHSIITPVYYRCMPAFEWSPSLPYSPLSIWCFLQRGTSWEFKLLT